MNIWKNTNTLDALIPDLVDTVEASEAEVALIGGKPIDVGAMPRLKGLFKCGVGTDNVPFDLCAEKGIEVCLPSQRTTEVIFEETASFATSLVYRMLFADVGTIESWKKEARRCASRKTVLVIGQGNIGKRVSSKLERTVKVVNYDLADTKGWPLDDLLADADIVSLHIPLTSGNRGFFGKERLGMMKDGAAVVNTARGPIVDEDALYSELRGGRLRAAFDVFWQEPYNGKLAALHPEPFFMTPHVASTCEEFLEGLAEDFEEFLKRLS